MPISFADVRQPRRPSILAVVLSLFSLGYLLPGSRLLALGGSPYYVVAGLLGMSVAVLLWRGSRAAGWLYAGFMSLTLIWALIEAGADAWALAPRLLMPAGFGVWIAAPWVRRWLARDAEARATAVRGTLASAAVSVAAGMLIAGLALYPRAAPRSALPEARAAAAPGPYVGPENGEWPEYGNTLAGTRFSPLTQLDVGNVGQLKLAWSYRTGVVQKGETSGMEATPLLVNGTLYFCTQTNVVIALDPETGVQKWRYDPKVDPTGASLVATCRGVAYAVVGASVDCPRRIITSTFDARLLAVNAETGEPCRSFGAEGTVDLKKGMGDVDPGFYYVSSAPTIVGGRIVLGGWIADNARVGEPSGVIRAYDVTDGRFVWAWDLGRPGWHDEPGPDESYTRGTPNSWAPMSGDEALGMVYLPTGNATPDHWAGHRSKLSDEFSTSVVALDAKTGELKWSFQTVHHDTWDYDVPAQPTLIDVTIDGATVPALIQATKQGDIYLLDRRNGKPLSPVEEKPVPHYAPPGDYHTPTQPYSVGMPSFSHERLRERDMWGITPFDQLWCRIQYRSLRYDGMYTPIMVDDPGLIFPGIGGGVNWGGVSVDPERGVMLVNSLRIGTVARLLPRAEADAMKSENSGNAVFHSLSAPLPQAGTPYAVLMGTFVSPLGVPCNKPPFGEMTAVDLHTR
ncbi:MAG: rane-bound PQQ-dependent dehydrogenase, glucose/quinate/shikimate family, partial [Gammaproteobacteria bacterium]|nr:rane-bound PQQ-dependent dehydrogenase, glucose/quinate/shikimate family [Gammaproteobacteria bacterium]